MRNYLILGLVVLVLLLFFLWRGSNRERVRLQGNYTALMDTAHKYRVRDSLSAISTSVLELEIDELRRFRKADASLIADMKIRLGRVNSVAKIATVGVYTFSLSGDNRWDRRGPYLEFSASQTADTLSVELTVRDTIIQILHRVPRFKILGIWFGTKAVRQEVVSKNPSVQIVAAEYLKIVR